jgi:hypothetical protein
MYSKFNHYFNKPEHKTGNDDFNFLKYEMLLSVALVPAQQKPHRLHQQEQSSYIVRDIVTIRLEIEMYKTFEYTAWQWSVIAATTWLLKMSIIFGIKLLRMAEMGREYSKNKKSIPIPLTGRGGL